ncbi:MAG TPA: MFS transporter [Actinophytocola sp.]|nr:MFS transporter [Actinophytocola sp.]
MAAAPVAGARLALSLGVLVAVPLLALNLRPAVTSVGAMLTDIRAGTGMSTVLASAVVAAPVWCFAAGGALAWTMRTRLGTSRTVSLALVVLAATLAARVMGGQYLLLLGTVVACLAIAVLGTLLPVITHAAPARAWALLTGCYVAAMGGGSGIGALITPQVAAESSWQLGVSGWALLAAAAWAAWRVAARRFSEPPVNNTTKRLGASGLTPAGTAWSLTLHFGLTSGFTFSIMGWLPSILVDYAHVEPAMVNWMFAVAMALGVPIALMVPRWARATVGQSGLVIVLAAPNLLAIGGMLLYPGVSPWFWAVLLGLGMPAVGLALAMISIRAAPDGDTAAALSSMVQGLGYAIAGVTCLGAGLLHSSTSSWEWPLLGLLAIICGQILTGVHAGLPVLVHAGLPGPEPRAPNPRVPEPRGPEPWGPQPRLPAARQPELPPARVPDHHPVWTGQFPAVQVPEPRQGQYPPPGRFPGQAPGWTGEFPVVVPEPRRGGSGVFPVPDPRRPGTGEFPVVRPTEMGEVPVGPRSRPGGPGTGEFPALPPAGEPPAVRDSGPRTGGFPAVSEERGTIAFPAREARRNGTAERGEHVTPEARRGGTGEIPAIQAEARTEARRPGTGEVPEARRNGAGEFPVVRPDERRGEHPRQNPTGEHPRRNETGEIPAIQAEARTEARRPGTGERPDERRGERSVPEARRPGSGERPDERRGERSVPEARRNGAGEFPVVRPDERRGDHATPEARRGGTGEIPAVRDSGPRSGGNDKFPAVSEERGTIAFPPRGARRNGPGPGGTGERPGLPRPDANGEFPVVWVPDHPSAWTGPFPPNKPPEPDWMAEHPPTTSAQHPRARAGGHPPAEAASAEQSTEEREMTERQATKWQAAELQEQTADRGTADEPLGPVQLELALVLESTGAAPEPPDDPQVYIPSPRDPIL